MFDDKNYFMYGEDQDLCLRSWRNDLKVIYNNVEQDISYAKEGGYIHIELFGNKENNFKELILLI